MKRRKNALPLGFFITAALFLCSVMLWILSSLSVSAADALNGGICQRIRRFTAVVSNIFPFSVGEILLYSLPVVAVALAVLAVILGNTRERRVRMIGWILTVVFAVGSLYPLTLGIAYKTTGIAKKMEMEDVGTDAETLFRTSAAILDEITPLLDEIVFTEDGSNSGMSLDGISREICTAYDSFVADYPETLTNFPSRAKAVKGGVTMSRLRLLGIYTFFTGESNVNPEPPDYTFPSTVAHEFAHQRGIIREDEANFVAFLVCNRSENAYVRYSGLLNLFEYVIGALSQSDPERCYALLQTADRRIFSDTAAYSRYYDKYDGAVIGNVSESMNDAYLKLNGTEGTVSYGLVVDLAVDYYEGKNK